MKTISKLDRIVELFTRVFAYVAACALIFNVIIILANVVLRAFGSSVIGTEEYVSLAEILVIFLALGYTQIHHGLVHVCFFMKKLPGVSSMVMWTIHMWVASVIVALWVYQTWVRIPNVSQVTQSLLIPLQPFYGVIMVGCIVYLVAQLYEAIKCTVGIFHKDIREDVMANWPA